MQLKSLCLCNFIITFWATTFVCCIIDKRENATIFHGKWGLNRTGKCRSTCLSMRVFMQWRQGKRQGEEERGRRRVVRFKGLSILFVWLRPWLMPRHTERMINMRGLLVQSLPLLPLNVIYDEICQTANTLSTAVWHTHTHLSTHMNNLMNVKSLSFSTREFALLAFHFNL